MTARSAIFPCEENVFLHEHNSPKYTRGIFLDFGKMAAHAQALVTQYAIKTPGLDTPIKNLSGGNIQKVILARELSRNPKILIAAQPTRGVDIGASEYIHQRLLEQRAAGMAILLISEDLDEIRALSDRIAVIYEGRIMGDRGPRPGHRRGDRPDDGRRADGSGDRSRAVSRERGSWSHRSHWAPSAHLRAAARPADSGSSERSPCQT